jgi:hypothetical protein
MMKLQEAIENLQAALANTYGAQVNTECGAATITIGHDRVELSDHDCLVVAEDADECCDLLQP